jgi:mxaA protein
MGAHDCSRVGALVRCSTVFLTLMWMGVSFATSAPLTALSADVRNPRPFGYVIGDRIEQRVTVHAPTGFAVVATSIPRAGRVDRWLQREPLRILRRARAGSTSYDISIDYQVVNVPEHLSNVELPELALQFSGAGQVLEQRIDAWPITIGPLTPSYVLSRAGLDVMRPDHEPPIIDTRPILGRIALWAVALAAVCLALAMSVFGVSFGQRARGPFARASRELEQLARLPASRTVFRQALQRLHRAFNETAGYTVFNEHLEPFLAGHAELAAHRTEIQRFFLCSQNTFFGEPREDIPATMVLADVVALALHCREAEYRSRTNRTRVSSHVPACL